MLYYTCTSCIVTSNNIKIQEKRAKASKNYTRNEREHFERLAVGFYGKSVNCPWPEFFFK